MVLGVLVPLVVLLMFDFFRTIIMAVKEINSLFPGFIVASIMLLF